MKSHRLMRRACAVALASLLLEGCVPHWHHHHHHHRHYDRGEPSGTMPRS